MFHYLLSEPNVLITCRYVGKSNRSNSAIVLKNGFILFCSVVWLLTIISGDLLHIWTSNSVKKSWMRPFSSTLAAFCLDTILTLKGIPLIPRTHVLREEESLRLAMPTSSHNVGQSNRPWFLILYL